MTDLLKKRCRQIYYRQKSRAREHCTTLDYQLVDLVSIVTRAMAEYVCPFCHGMLKEGTFSIDHNRPVSRSNDFGLSNLAVCCERCNQIKGSLTGEEFQSLMHLICTWHPAAGNDVLCRLRAGGKVRSGRM